MDFTSRCWRGLDGLIRLPQLGCPCARPPPPRGGAALTSRPCLDLGFCRLAGENRAKYRCVSATLARKPWPKPGRTQFLIVQRGRSEHLFTVQRVINAGG